MSKGDFSEGFLGRCKLSGIVPLTKSTVQLSVVIQAFRMGLWFLWCGTNRYRVVGL